MRNTGTASAPTQVLLSLGRQPGPALLLLPTHTPSWVLILLLLIYMSVNTPMLPEGKHNILGTYIGSPSSGMLGM